MFVFRSWLQTSISWPAEGTNNDNTDFKSGHWYIIMSTTADNQVHQLLSFVLVFDERKITIIFSADCTYKTNTYLVLRRNYFRYCGSTTFSVILKPNYTFPFEVNNCQRNSFCCCCSLHSRFILTQILHSLLMVIPVKGTGSTANYRNSCNYCSFLAEIKETSKRELTIYISERPTQWF